MLFSTKPMNMKNRLTRGNGVAERIISERERERERESNIEKDITIQKHNLTDTYSYAHLQTLILYFHLKL